MKNSYSWQTIGSLVLLVVLLVVALVSSAAQAYWIPLAVIVCFAIWVLFLLVYLEERNRKIEVLTSEIKLLRTPRR